MKNELVTTMALLMLAYNFTGKDLDNLKELAPTLEDRINELQKKDNQSAKFLFDVFMESDLRNRLIILHYASKKHGNEAQNAINFADEYIYEGLLPEIDAETRELINNFQY